MLPEPQSSCVQHMESAIADDVMPPEQASLASIAISLKRIADTLDGSNTAVPPGITAPYGVKSDGSPRDLEECD